MKRKRFLVIGLGKFGFHAAKALYEDGHEVVAVDLDPHHVQRMVEYASEALVLDATDKDQLAALSPEEFDAAVVSTGNDISVSILITLNLTELGMKKILTKAVDVVHGKILRKVGASEIIEPEKSMALRMAKSLTTPNMIDFLPLEEDYSLLQIGPPKQFIGKSLAELDLRAKYKVYVIAIKEILPGTFTMLPPADFVIKDSDVLLMVGRQEDIRRLSELK